MSMRWKVDREATGGEHGRVEGGQWERAEGGNGLSKLLLASRGCPGPGHLAELSDSTSCAGGPLGHAVGPS